MKIIALLLSFIGVAMLALSFTKAVVKTAVKKNINTAMLLNLDKSVNRSQINITAAGKWKIVNDEGYKPAGGREIKHNYVSGADDRSRANKTDRLLVAGNSNGYKAASLTYDVTSAPKHYNTGKNIKNYVGYGPIMLAELPVSSENRLALTTGLESPVYALN
ncbi:hypothetical protein [Mucilaginibacter ginsenosidivorans]|uniref:Uncharacterized protein n=1 Tax=Mucilaginibacter ginsenosidivorans TaxID=398053 RepID=A0A5B8UZ66_9SPHI|nr:hypothetical protein [Mucilaginibacter ginsenosidivorans]QEC63661.1 hypothetical protein FRZ54_14100 [Mucilaginibacter ginsenosidivorans]